jgi:excisionase family DNA binding protein
MYLLGVQDISFVSVSNAVNKETDVLLWTQKEVAQQLQVSTKTITRLIQDGVLPVVRIRGCIRIETQAVYHFVEGHRQYNGHCVESAVQNPTGESICRIGTRRDVKMAVSTKVRITRSASPQMEKDFNALLGLKP